MNKRTITLCFLVLCCFLISGCQCEHQWVDATCTVPKTCTLCEKTEGDALGHNWNAATCTAPKTCTRCLTTEGQALDHQEGNWEVSSEDLVDAKIISKKNCNICGTTLDRKTESLNTLHNGDYFILSPKEFVARLNNKLDEINGNELSSVTGSLGDDFACGIFADGNRVGAFLFTYGESTITTTQKNDPCFNKALGTISGAENVSRVLIAIIGTCDPSLSFSEAKNLAGEVLRNGSATENEITYVFSLSNGDDSIIGFTIAD